MNFCEHFHLRWWIRQNIVSEDEEYQFNILKEVAINVNFARDISLDLSLKGTIIFCLLLQRTVFHIGVENYRHCDFLCALCLYTSVVSMRTSDWFQCFLQRDCIVANSFYGNEERSDIFANLWARNSSPRDRKWKFCLNINTNYPFSILEDVGIRFIRTYCNCFKFSANYLALYVKYWVPFVEKLISGYITFIKYTNVWIRM